MKGINHLVLVGQDLASMRSAYAALGFTLTAQGRHPFGTDNTVIQLEGNYLELLSVARPRDIPEHTENSFSFAAFNRDYLARHEGFSMIVFDTDDARVDINAWRKAGLRSYDAVDFSRQAKLPDGTETRVGFSLSFVTNPAAPWLGTFACQHLAPEYYAQPVFQKHDNMAVTVEEVWAVGSKAEALLPFFETVTGCSETSRAAGRISLKTRSGALVLATPAAFADAFNCPPPNSEDAPCLAGLVIGCRSLTAIERLGLRRIGSGRFLAPPENMFGTALVFREITPASR